MNVQKFIQRICLIAIVLRFFLYQPFSIPTASMQQTLMTMHGKA